MIYTPLTKLALKLCFEKHKDEVDKSGIPYPFHPYEVASHMNDEDTICVALLHDLLEDTPTTIDELYQYGFSKEIIEAITLMTRKEGIDYLDYVKKVKENPLARKVKIADLKHNMDLSRLDNVTKKDLERIEKYKKALFILEND